MWNRKTNGKSVILYHRSYRNLPGSTGLFLLQFLFLAIPFSVLTVLFYPQITHVICLIAESVLSPFFFSDSIRIVEAPLIEIIGKISLLDVPGKLPTFNLALGNALVSLLFLIFLPRIETGKPMIIFSVMVSSLHLISSLFFLIIPSQFPYDAADYSQLYMIQQISIWFFVPLIMGFAILPLPSALILKCFIMGITYTYSLVFGTVRYAVFLFILAKASLIYMPILFFVFGPLIDFIYIVGIYSIHITRLSLKLKGDFSLWRWRYSS